MWHEWLGLYTKSNLHSRPDLAQFSEWEMLQIKVVQKKKLFLFNNCPTRCDLFSLLYFCRQLYMFRVFTPIIKSSYSCNYSFWCWLTGSATIRSRCCVGTRLYMFRVLTPIIRSSYNCNYCFWCWLTGSATIRSRCWVGTTYRTIHMNQFQLNNESGW